MVVSTFHHKKEKDQTIMKRKVQTSPVSLLNVVPASVALLDARPTGDQEVAGSIPSGRQHSFMEIDHEILSTVILSLPLIKEGQLSVSVE